MTTETYNYTGAPVWWPKPVGVSKVELDASGAQGGGSNGGKGGTSSGTLDVSGVAGLWVYVGQNPSGSTGGWNGGGAGFQGGAAGGGASDVRIGGQSLSDRAIVAGGGGGEGVGGYFNGGKGGGTTGTKGGEDNDSPAGGGGTQSSGGAGGGGGNNGTKGDGGKGGDGGGAGGGGYFGGGGGEYGGGGGGSGYKGGVTNGSTTQGGTSGNGQIKITYVARIDGDLGSTAPAGTAAFTGEIQTIDGILTASAPAGTATFAGLSDSADYLQAVAPAATATFAADQQNFATLNAVAPAATIQLKGAPGSRGILTAPAPAARAMFGAARSASPTWQAVVSGEDFGRAVDAQSRTVSSRVDVIAPDGSVVQTVPISAGSVSCDGSVDERWAASVTIADTTLLPHDEGDHFHPLSGMRVRIWWELLLDTGFSAEIPVGTYYPSSPSATHQRDGVGFTISLLDTVARVRRNKWSGGDSMDLGGLTVSAALQRLLKDRAPEAALNIADTDATLPELYEVGEPGRDPWEDILAICEAGSYMVYSDRVGVLVGEPIPAAQGTPNITLTLGERGRLISVDRSLDDSDLFNVVTVQSSNPDVDPPVWATVQDQDFGSPLNVSRGWKYSTTITSDSVTTTGACRDLAATILAKHRALLETVDITHQSRPDLDPYDLAVIGDSEVGATGTYQVSSWALDLSPGSTMRTVAFQRRLKV